MRLVPICEIGFELLGNNKKFAIISSLVEISRRLFEQLLSAARNTHVAHVRWQ
jgi:hypothetical protein